MPEQYKDQASTDFNFYGNLFEINEDAVAGTAEDSKLRLLAGDGSNLQKWQLVNDSSEKDLLVQYAQNSGSYKSLFTISDNGVVTLGDGSTLSSSLVLKASDGDTATLEHDGTTFDTELSAGSFRYIISSGLKFSIDASSCTSENRIIVDRSDSEAFLVRQNGDAADIFSVDSNLGWLGS